MDWPPDFILQLQKRITLERAISGDPVRCSFRDENVYRCPAGDG
jgi:hypothetical protein